MISEFGLATEIHSLSTLAITVTYFLQHGLGGAENRNDLPRHKKYGIGLLYGNRVYLFLATVATEFPAIAASLERA